MVMLTIPYINKDVFDERSRITRLTLFNLYMPLSSCWPYLNTNKRCSRWAKANNLFQHLSAVRNQYRLAVRCWNLRLSEGRAKLAWAMTSVSKLFHEDRRCWHFHIQLLCKQSMYIWKTFQWHSTALFKCQQFCCNLWPAGPQTKKTPRKGIVHKKRKT